MSEAQPASISPPLSLPHRLAIYAALCASGAAFIAPLGGLGTGGWLEFALYRFGVAAWGAQVLIVVAVLTLSVRSLVVAFQLALLAALLQGYLCMASQALWYEGTHHDAWDNPIQFALILGLSATLYAVLWLLVRIVWKVGLSAEAAEGSGRSGQFGLRELLYAMASLSAVLGFISLFSFKGVVPVEQMLWATILYAAQFGPLAYGPFWLAACSRFQTRHWLWVAPLTLLFVAFLVRLEFEGTTWRPWYYATAMFAGTALGTASIVAANAVALRLLGLTWWPGGAAASAPQMGRKMIRQEFVGRIRP